MPSTQKERRYQRELKWQRELRDKGIKVELEDDWYTVTQTADGRFLHGYKHKLRALKKAQEIINFREKKEGDRIAYLRDKPCFVHVRDIKEKLGPIRELIDFINENVETIKNMTEQRLIVVKQLELIYNGTKEIEDVCDMLRQSIPDMYEKEEELNDEDN